MLLHSKVLWPAVLRVEGLGSWDLGWFIAVVAAWLRSLEVSAFGAALRRP